MPKALEVENLHVEVEGKRVLRGVTLSVGEGEVHALMGPNGSGKSTLAYTIAGKPGYEVVEGDVRVRGRSVLGLEPEERAALGVFLAFQEPPPLPGVRLAALVNAVYNKRAGRPISSQGDPRVYRRLIQALAAVGLDASYATRELHVGFSGGEKKRAEVAQALVLEPTVVILDEPDSGLDADGVRRIAEVLDRMRREGRALLVITHYARLLRFLEPDEVTVLAGGRVAARGGPELAREIEERGYKGILEGGE